MGQNVLLLGAGFVTRPTAVELDKAGVNVTVGKQSMIFCQWLSHC